MLPSAQSLPRLVALPIAGTRGRPRLVLALLGITLVAVVALFMTYDLKGSLAFALEWRGRKVVGMALVGFAIGYSSVLFHTITHNRILTPSLMGFDALYVLIQVAAAFFFGTWTFLSLDVRLRFGIEVVLMLGFAGLLYRLLFGRESRDLFVLVLAGIIMGAIFGSLTSLLTRLIDPNEFLTLQDLLFASFNAVNHELLLVAAALTALLVAASWPLLTRLDVVVLGREPAISLGVEYPRLLRQALVVIAALVSIATALVGPVAFLGLLVSHLAYQFTGTFRHRYTVLAAGLIAVIALVGGQFIMEEVFESGARLSVIITFIGGGYLILLLIRESRR